MYNVEVMMTISRVYVYLYQMNKKIKGGMNA